MEANSNNSAPIVVSPVCFVIKASRRLPMPPSFFVGFCKKCTNNNMNGPAFLSGKELADTILTCNLSRRLSCARCGKLGTAHESDAIDEWSQPEKLSGVIDEIVTTQPPDRIPPRPSSAPVKMQLLEVKDGTRPVTSVFGMPNAMAQLQRELGSESIGKFLVSLKPQVRARDAFRLGMTQEMAFCQTDSWDIVFRDAYYTPNDLMNLGGNFTRMLIAGLPEASLANSAIDEAGLAIIRFNRHALDCAEWSEATWRKYTDNPETARLFEKMGSATCRFCSYRVKAGQIN